MQKISLKSSYKIIQSFNWTKDEELAVVKLCEDSIDDNKTAMATKIHNSLEKMDDYINYNWIVTIYKGERTFDYYTFRYRGITIEIDGYIIEINGYSGRDNQVCIYFCSKYIIIRCVQRGSAGNPPVS